LTTPIEPFLIFEKENGNFGLVKGIEVNSYGNVVPTFYDEIEATVDNELIMTSDNDLKKEILVLGENYK
jgi:hypothetical protein